MTNLLGQIGFCYGHDLRLILHSDRGKDHESWKNHSIDDNFYFCSTPMPMPLTATMAEGMKTWAMGLSPTAGQA